MAPKPPLKIKMPPKVKAKAASPIVLSEESDSDKAPTDVVQSSKVSDSDKSEKIEKSESEKSQSPAASPSRSLSHKSVSSDDVDINKAIEASLMITESTKAPVSAHGSSSEEDKPTPIAESLSKKASLQTETVPAKKAAALPKSPEKKLAADVVEGPKSAQKPPKKKSKHHTLSHDAPPSYTTGICQEYCYRKPPEINIMEGSMYTPDFYTTTFPFSFDGCSPSTTYYHQYPIDAVEHNQRIYGEAVPYRNVRVLQRHECMGGLIPCLGWNEEIDGKIIGYDWNDNHTLRGGSIRQQQTWYPLLLWFQSAE